MLVPKLLCVQGEYGVIYPRNLARRIASRRHFLGSKLNEAEGEFEEGHRLCGEQRFREAAERWGRAALLGHAIAQNNLGNVFEDGQGVAKDRAEAIRWYRLAAAQGNASATVALRRSFK